VRIEPDQTGKKIVEKTKSFAQNVKTKEGLIIVAIFSHGREGLITGKIKNIQTNVCTE
jgi:hypothetical protein